MSGQIGKNDERVRLRAYHLWEQDGRPHGRNDQYWQIALRQVQAEERQDAGQDSAARPDPS